MRTTIGRWSERAVKRGRKARLAGPMGRIAGTYPAAALTLKQPVVVVAQSLPDP
jgi:hypothetical protein